MARKKQKQEFKNQETDLYEIESDDEECEETILNLSRQNLRCLPYKVAKEKANDIHTLILTKNKLCSFRYLSLFRSLTTLQLDGNHITDELFAYFPALRCLNTLWLNNNNLCNLNHLLFILASQCPKLEYLSLLFNPLCPFTNNDDDNGTRYIEYRHKVISRLPLLKFLDILGISTRIAIDLDDLSLLSVIEINAASLHGSVLRESHLKRVICHCATITHFVEWTCFYNTACDGFSKTTFFNEINKINDDKSLLIIRDTTNHVFGAYIDGATWRKSLRYRGGCDSFVFHFGGRYNNDSVNEYNHNLYIHKATGCEPYYLQFNHKDITIGCGESAAIYFDMDFNIGTTAHCKTFNNPPLTQHTQFIIQSIEIWAPLLNF